eukprot:5727745-Pleurochrysis_carterae.AAC.1
MSLCAAGASRHVDEKGLPRRRGGAFRRARASTREKATAQKVRGLGAWCDKKQSCGSSVLSEHGGGGQPLVRTSSALALMPWPSPLASLASRSLSMSSGMSDGSEA